MRKASDINSEKVFDAVDVSDNVQYVSLNFKTYFRMFLMILKTYLETYLKKFVMLF